MFGVRHPGYVVPLGPAMRIWVNVDRCADLVRLDLRRLAVLGRRNQIANFLQIPVGRFGLDLPGLLLLQLPLARSRQDCEGQAQQPECCACDLAMAH
jgi:hypothetical protein